MTTYRVSRWVRGYEKTGDALVVEFRLPESCTLGSLQKLFGISEENPMYDCYPIDDAVARILEPSLGVSLSTGDYDLFLEADSEGEE